ncbi:chloramphenicol acetyltransferase [Mucilaginibacter sp. PPCGB 2223]|uniref:chloramphenicol acetyltransferase n=1 Tax=Mucilaginibacter sp. PPCGB 2223 TaxID=1886027 RepID=UPI0008247702|nr:chloramphenicol acetyltransferase [Mucilaginibacter sp. PPCGB 2223]OCX51219.1 chloramphenicol acetyltransferase [Mucilaginibacter sp. PPCGB 2223]
MRQKLNIATWNRREHFNFFKTFDQPYYGVTVQLDCTRAYERCKLLGVSFYSYYLHKTLVAVHAIENFRYRIEGDEVYVCEQVDASSTILRDDHTFGFSHIKFKSDIHDFHREVDAEIVRIKNTSGLFTTGPLPDVIYFSALPWVNFSSISEAFNKNPGDSCPKIAVGKLTETDGRKMLPFGIHVHHALVDGYHVGLFVDKLQTLLNE